MPHWGETLVVVVGPLVLGAIGSFIVWAVRDRRNVEVRIVRLEDEALTAKGALARIEKTLDTILGHLLGKKE